MKPTQRSHGSVISRVKPCSQNKDGKQQEHNVSVPTITVIVEAHPAVTGERYFASEALQRQMTTLCACTWVSHTTECACQCFFASKVRACRCSNQTTVSYTRNGRCTLFTCFLKQPTYIVLLFA